MKPSLVTGACGFVGTHLVKHLVELGEPVRATDLAGAMKDLGVRFVHEKLDVDFERDGVEFVPADLTDKESLRPAVRGAGTVYHTASLYDYSAPMSALEKVNIFGTTNLCEVMVEEGVERVIHWSTNGVYGRPNMPRSYRNPLRTVYEMIRGQWLWPWLKDKEYKRPGKYPTNVPFSEDGSTPITTPGDGPEGTYLVNDYSVTKWKQEQIIYGYFKEKGLLVTIIRPSVIYGPGSDYGMGGIIITLSEGFWPILSADMADFMMVSVHVRDVARAAHFLARKEEAIGEAYNITDDSVMSQLEFMKLAALLLGRKVHTIPLVYLSVVKPLAILYIRTGEWLQKKFDFFELPRFFEESSTHYLSSSYWIDNQKIKRLGFEFEYPDARVGVRDTVAWFIRAGWIK